MKKINWKKLLISLLCVTLITASVVTVTALASEPKGDAMIAIKQSLGAKQIGDTVAIDKDGYIGIPVELTTYYDYAKHGAAKTGYNGTPLIIYVVNTATERIGAKTDVEIISSMLNDGYVVAVLDYKNNAKSSSPNIDWSTQTIRVPIMNGNYFTDKDKIPTGTFQSNYIVPAGYDVSIGNVFWESDKHGADGTLEKIVENWNSDFRGWYRNTVIYWLAPDGTQKSTQKGLDGSEPQWYSDSAGKNKVSATDPNAKYIKAQHTLAKDVTDCVGKDGTPIDINLYMDIVYPTTKDGEGAIDPVPIAVLASSTEYLTTASTGSGLRPQHNGFLFNGYAGATFDYLYQPMAQKDYYGYYDGRTDQGALTGDRMNYGLHLYNDKRINTAAMRYLRYLTLTEPETYSFDTEAIGVFGNSKGGWFTFLGEKELQNPTEVLAGKTLAESIDARINAYTSKRTFENHNGESRYQNGVTGYTKNGVTIDSGELQPWLTYTDENGVVREIASHCNWVYASNGSQNEDITENHVPTFIALHLRDDFSTYANAFSEVVNAFDNIPYFYVVVDLGHTFAYGPDAYYGYDTYQAMFDFAGYYLKGDAVKVVFVSPDNEEGGVKTTSPIRIKFSGAVEREEVEKITVTSSGKAAKGSWSYTAGKTEWVFTPDALTPGATYAVNVPATLKGDNGKEIGTAYTSVFYTEIETVNATETVTTEKGTYITFNAPSMVSASDARIRFHVTNDAANVMGLYLVPGFNASNPDSSAVGDVVDTLNLRGAGYYEMDVSELVSSANGNITFLLKAEKLESTTNKTVSVSTASLSTYARKTGETTAPDGTAAVGFYINENIKENGSHQYPYEVFYANPTTAFTLKNLFTSSNNVTVSDYGRKFSVSVRVYDTASRTIQIEFGAAYTADNGIHDFDKCLYNFKTVANEWTTLTFDYTVYEAHYGDLAATSKTLNFKLGSTGVAENPIYIENFKVTEYVTAVELDVDDPAVVVLGSGDSAYKESSDGAAFTVGDNGYDTLKAALAAAKSGDVVKFNKNYVTTAEDNFAAWESLSNITLDLNGYKVYVRGGNSLINAKATSNNGKTTITVQNGSVYLYNAPLVSYTGSNSSGRGKNFVIDINNVNILNTDDSRLYYVMSAPSIESSSSAGVTFNLSNSSIRLEKKQNTMNPVTIFPASAGGLDVQFNVKGGSIYFDSLARVTIAASAKNVLFVPDVMSEYTHVVAPSSIDPSSISVIRSDGYASLKAKSTSLGITTYETEIGELSTKYGIIPKEYADADSYPFIMFNENGVFVGGYSIFSDAAAKGVMPAARFYVVNSWNGTSYGDNPKEAFIVMRRNYTMDSTKDSIYDNLAQTQGTINIDLGGYTLSTGNLAVPIFPAYSKGWSGASSGNPIFPTTINVSNGKILQYKSGVVSMKTWDSAGGGTIAGKDFNFNFTGVTFGFVQNADCAGLLAHGLGEQGTPGAAAPFNITYNDCTFDLRSTQGKYNPVIFALSAANDNFIKLTIKVNGGKIIANDPSKVTVVKASNGNDYGSSITFSAGSDGSLIKYYTPTGTTVAGGDYPGEKGISYAFSKIGTEGSDDVYTLTMNPLATEYGTITDTYADANAYPFAVFDSNGFVQAYALFSQAVDKAKVLSNSAEKTVTILLRTDNYTIKKSSFNKSPQGDAYDNWAQVKGTVVIDLNGGTITQGSDSDSIFAVVNSKGASGTVFPSNYVIKNGTLLAGSKPVFNARMWTTTLSETDPTPVDMTQKIFTWDFENVTFGFASGASTTSLFVGYTDPQAANNPATAPFYFNFKGCEFDMTNAPSEAVIFDAAPAASKMIKSVFTVTGGKITAESFTSSQLFKTSTSSNDSSIIFKKGADGEYIKLYVKTGASAPAISVPTDAGNLAYSKSGLEGAYDVYTLVSLKTPYGDIPAQYASVQDYPFVLFDKNGFVSAHSTFYGTQSGASAIGKAIYTVLKENNYDGTKWVGDVNEVFILMRRDYMLGTDEYHDNLAHTKGNLTIDLGGFTLSECNQTKTGNAASRKPSIFVSIAKRYDTNIGNMVFPSNYTVKNGSINVFKGSVIYFEAWQPSAQHGVLGDKAFNWNFEGVTFGFQAGATSSSLVSGSFGKYGSNVVGNGVAPLGLNLTDCTFDLTKNAPSSGVTVFGNDFTADYCFTLSINVFGGKVIANSLSAVTFFNQNSPISSVAFGPSASGDFEVSLPAGSSYPSHTILFYDEDGTVLTLLKTAVEGGFDTYVPTKGEVTKYGTIPAKYTDKDAYPFIIFLNGEFRNASNIFGKSGAASALHHAKADGCVILLRRDFVYSESQYDNLSQTNGAITIDLDGHTIYCRQSGSNSLFYAQKKTNYNSSVTIINGTILTAKNPIVMYSAWAANGNYSGGYKFDIKFDNVTLGADAGSAPSCLIATTIENTGAPLSISSLTLNDCIINLAGLTDTLLVSVNDASGAVKVTVKIGGNTVIYGDDTSAIEFFKVAQGSSAMLGENVKLIANVGNKTVFNTESGTMAFFKSGEEDGKSVFTLAAAEYSDFVVKTGLTLWNDFVYTVYIPVVDYLDSVVLAGNTVNLSALEKVTLEDGASYYKLTYGIPVTRALESFELTVNLDTATTTVVLSIPEYASSVIENSECTAEEKALVKDMLSYIRASYNYFDSADKDKISVVDSIIGKSYDTTSSPDMSKANTAVVPAGTGFTGVSINLGDTIAYRFYYEGTTPDYSFKVGSNTVVAASGSDTVGNFLEIRLGAHEMLSDITFGSFTYNVYTYYAWAVENSEDAAFVVERLVKYCESAQSYKNSKAKNHFA